MFSKLSSDDLRKLSDKIDSEAYDKFAKDVFFADEDERKTIINLAKGMDWNFLQALQMFGNLRNLTGRYMTRFANSTTNL